MLEAILADGDSGLACVFRVSFSVTTSPVPKNPEMSGNEPQRACESHGDGIRQTFLGFITMASNPAAPKPKQATNQTNKTLGRQEMLSLSSDSESEGEKSPPRFSAAKPTMAVLKTPLVDPFFFLYEPLLLIDLSQHLWRPFPRKNLPPWVIRSMDL